MVSFDQVKQLQDIRAELAGGRPAFTEPEPEPEPAFIPTASFDSGGSPQFGGGMGTGTGGGGANLRGAVSRAASGYGWSGNEFAALDRLIQKESSWNPKAQNPTSTAWGLFQFLNMHWGPGKYLPKGRSSSTSEQIQGGLRYIKDRYGSPSQALAFHQRNNWY